MPYIDKNYYDDEYKGMPITDQSLFDRLAVKASDLIDQLTSYKIENINTLTAFQQTQVKKSVSAQIEYMATTGGELSIHGPSGISNANIGNFNFSQESSSKNIISPAVLEYLRPTGLLYRGVNVRDSSYSITTAYPYNYL